MHKGEPAHAEKAGMTYAIHHPIRWSHHTTMSGESSQWALRAIPQGIW